MERLNKNEEALISVIVPVYNASPWLKECVESILAQTYRRFEIILVNDGSTDDSGEICDEYASCDDRIRVIHQANKGVGAARNAGLDAAVGAYIGWVDSDDRIEPEMYERLIAAGTDVSACAFRTFGKGREAVCLCGTCGIYRQPQIMEVMAHIPVLWNKLARRELWEGLRFPICRVFDDETVSCTLLARAGSLAVTDEPLYGYRFRPGSVSNRFRPEDCLPALDAACARYVEMQELQSELSIYFLLCVYEILRSLNRAMAWKWKTHRALRTATAPATALVSSHQQELISCMGLGYLGRLEIAALAQGSYWACPFSSLCQRVYDWNYRRRQQNI